MGTADTFFRSPDPDGNWFPAPGSANANGSTGLAWVYAKNHNSGNQHRRLFLVDCKDGGNSSPVFPSVPQYWSVLDTIDMSVVATGWHRLSIAYTAATGAVVAKFDAQTFNHTSATNLAGSFYVGYN